MLVYNVYIAILTLTSEYRETVTKLQASFFSGTADWGSVCQTLLKDF
jgi:hypothetical protein